MINLNLTFGPDLYCLYMAMNRKIWPIVSFSFFLNDVTLTECGKTAVSTAVDGFAVNYP